MKIANFNIFQNNHKIKNKQKTAPKLGEQVQNSFSYPKNYYLPNFTGKKLLIF